MAEEYRKLKLMFHATEATGHLNAAIGFAQTLADRGHEILFVINETLKDYVAKYGFRVLALKQDTEKNKSSENEEFKIEENASKQFGKAQKDQGIMSNKSSFEKMKTYETESFKKMMQGWKDLMIDFSAQVDAFIEQEKPDAWIQDHILLLPAAFKAQIPWVNVCSCAPLWYYLSPKLPPPGSGYSMDEKDKWEEFENVRQALIEDNQKNQRLMNEHFGVAGEELRKGSYFTLSPYLNVYQYPLELDYSENDVKLPDNFIRVDSFSRKDPRNVKISEKVASLKSANQKMIYLSLGSTGSYDIEVMQRITGILSKLPYKVIVSKGTRGDEYELPDNCWGENFLPQPEIVEGVDLVITHGGNNTVTEVFAAGKPMIVIPLFADQFDNAQRLTETGYGARLDLYDFNDQDLVDAVERLINNDEVAKKFQAAKMRIANSNCREEAAKKVEEMIFKHKSQK